MVESFCEYLGITEKCKEEAVKENYENRCPLKGRGSVLVCGSSGPENLITRIF
jgi:hypothetical protein